MLKIPASNHDLVSVEQLSPADVLAKIKLAQAFKQGAQVHLRRPAYAMNLFFENSTRTHTSFEMAEHRLGMQVLDFSPAASSVTKGESLVDTLHTIQAIGVDIAVVRHAENHYYRPILAAKLQIGLANAGDGSGQHPSQSLLDMLTIYEEFGHFEGLRVGIIGDLAHSRVARSNTELLTKLGAKVVFGGPTEWFPSDFAQAGPHLPMDEIVQQVDVVMLLRVQHERLSTSAEGLFDATKYHQQYGLTVARAKQMRKKAIIMHPAPVNRGIEIADELVEAPQSRIFQQMHNGMFMRMAILADLLAAQDIIDSHELEGLIK